MRLAALVVCACLVATPATAELITYRIDTRVADIPLDRLGGLDDRDVFVGTKFTAFVTLNTEAPPHSSDPNTYIEDDPQFRLGSVFLYAGSVEISGTFLFFVRNNGDRLRVEVEDARSNYGFFDMITLDLFSDSEIPDGPLAVLDTINFTSGSFQAGHFSACGACAHLTSSIGTVSRVPEPATVLSVAIGVIGFVARGRTRRTRMR